MADIIVKSGARRLTPRHRGSRGGAIVQSKNNARIIFRPPRLAKLAAQRCKEENLLRVVRTTARGKAVEEVVTITPKGLDHLLSESNPAPGAGGPRPRH